MPLDNHLLQPNQIECGFFVKVHSKIIEIDTHHQGDKKWFEEALFLVNNIIYGFKRYFR